MTGFGITHFDSDNLLGAKNLKSLNVSNNAIESLPSKVFAAANGIQIIDYSQNKIADMAVDVFDNIKLIEIYLNHNNLTYVRNEWFRGLSNLRVLILNDNFLEQIDADSVFNTNYRLSTLLLQNNQLAGEMRFDMRIVQRLQIFNISNNVRINQTTQIKINGEGKQSTIDITNTNSDFCFIGAGVDKMYAKHNRITSEGISIDTSDNQQLKELYLANNLIESIGFLRNLNSLEIIDLSNNFITIINGTHLLNNLHVTKLILSHNKIKSIDLKFTEYSPNLIYLDISYNQLDGRFALKSKAEELRELNIVGNNYTSFAVDIKQKAPNLKLIDLNENWFSCNELSSTILFFHFDNITIINQNNDLANNSSNVHGIRCHNISICKKSNDDTNQKRTLQQEEILNVVDEKLIQLEAKLIELFKSVQNQARMATMSQEFPISSFLKYN